MNSSKFACVGIDIGKSVFHVVGLDLHGAVGLRGKYSRAALVPGLIQCDAPYFAFEACGGAHDLARRLRAAGREARLL